MRMKIIWWKVLVNWCRILLVIFKLHCVEIDLPFGLKTRLPSWVRWGQRSRGTLYKSPVTRLCSYAHPSYNGCASGRLRCVRISRWGNHSFAFARGVAFTSPSTLANFTLDVHTSHGVWFFPSALTWSLSHSRSKIVLSLMPAGPIRFSSAFSRPGPIVL